MTPLDTWLICGRSLARGCTCKPHDPTAAHAAKALVRLANEKTEEDDGAQRSPRHAP